MTHRTERALVEPIADVIAYWISDKQTPQRTALYEEIADNGLELRRLLKNAAYTWAVDKPGTPNVDWSVVSQLQADDAGGKAARAYLHTAVQERLSAATGGIDA